jgi:hypothetical protein
MYSTACGVIACMANVGRYLFTFLQFLQLHADPAYIQNKVCRAPSIYVLFDTFLRRVRVCRTLSRSHYYILQTP